MRYAALVFRDSFLKSAEAGRMGLPAVPLSQLYGEAASYIEARGGECICGPRWIRYKRIDDGVRVCVGGEEVRADFAILATPFNGVEKLLPDTPEMQPLREQAQPSSARRLSPASTCGSIARSRPWNTPCCWSGRSSGCSRSRRS